MPRENVAISAGTRQLIVKSTNDSVDNRSDTVNLAVNEREIVTKALYIGVSGDVKFLSPGGDAVTYYNVPVGKWVIACKRVFSTGTDADEIVADFDFPNE